MGGGWGEGGRATPTSVGFMPETMWTFCSQQKATHDDHFRQSPMWDSRTVSKSVLQREQVVPGPISGFPGNLLVGRNFYVYFDTGPRSPAGRDLPSCLTFGCLAAEG